MGCGIIFAVLRFWAGVWHMEVAWNCSCNNLSYGVIICIVNANIDTHGTLVEGVPVVIGEYQFDGVDEGIYAQFDSMEYGRDLSYTLLPHDDTISSVFGAGWSA